MATGKREICHISFTFPITVASFNLAGPLIAELMFYIVGLRLTLSLVTITMAQCPSSVVRHPSSSSSSVGGACFVTAGAIWLKLGVMMPLGNTPRWISTLVDKNPGLCGLLFRCVSGVK
jgi:hypothetical protein